jgi:hypothetical protein
LGKEYMVNVNAYVRKFVKETPYNHVRKVIATCFNIVGHIYIDLSI